MPLDVSSLIEGITASFALSVREMLYKAWFVSVVTQVVSGWLFYVPIK